MDKFTAALYNNITRSYCAMQLIYVSKLLIVNFVSTFINYDGMKMILNGFFFAPFRAVSPFGSISTTQRSALSILSWPPTSRSTSGEIRTSMTSTPGWVSNNLCQRKRSRTTTWSIGWGIWITGELLNDYRRPSKLFCLSKIIGRASVWSKPKHLKRSVRAFLCTIWWFD